MKAVLLAAGVGSRIRPLTDNQPKSFIPVAGVSILERMLKAVQEVGITEVGVVTGYLAEQVQEFITDKFPQLHVTFMHNEKYEVTNTGYSLLLTKDFVGDDSFIKFDADVVFETAVLRRLIDADVPSALCIDKNINLEAEEVKVITDAENKVMQVGKKLDPHQSTGESIGIEKIDKDAAKVLFAELESLMKDQANWQEYYDDSYTTLVAKGCPMYAVDITGLKWVEIDTHEDYAKAQEMFAE
jgi:choline kinase